MKAAFLYSFAKFVEWPSDAFGAARAPSMRRRLKLLQGGTHAGQLVGALS
ncbi:unnamed protein product [marine sediment metagenome]|uniref:Uncharacterized protein n=1 Tax=marine sediment metagenome TaxID=412755 RepID=X0VJA7_9ZZZZ